MTIKLLQELEKRPATDRLHVLLWSPKGAGTHYGGPGTSAYRLYSKADPSRLNISLAHGYAKQATESLFKDQYFLGPAQTNIGQWLFLASSRRWLAEHAAQFDVFHGVNAYHNVVQPALEAQRHGLPAVVKPSSHRGNLVDKPGWRSMLGFARHRRQMIKELAGIIAISRAIRDELLEYGVPESKIARIPNGVDVERFHPLSDPRERRELRRELGWHDMPTLLFVGSINQTKQPLLLIEALGLLRRKNIECQLVLCGPEVDPIYSARLRARSEELGISSHVVWFGFTLDVARLYCAADFYALPSSNEGMPNALLEAMSSGLPSIVTAISGTTDLISNDIHGYLVEAAPDHIAEALLAYLQSSTLAQAHGEAARRKIMCEYSSDAVLNAHEQMFKRILAGQDAAG